MVLIHDIVDTKSVTASLENISANFATVVELAPCRMVQQLTVLDRAEGFEENFEYPKRRILDGDGEKCGIHTASCVAFCPVCDEPRNGAFIYTSFGPQGMHVGVSTMFLVGNH